MKLEADIGMVCGHSSASDIKNGVLEVVFRIPGVGPRYPSRESSYFTVSETEKSYSNYGRRTAPIIDYTRQFPGSEV